MLALASIPPYPSFPSEFWPTDPPRCLFRYGSIAVPCCPSPLKLLSNGAPLQWRLIFAPRRLPGGSFLNFFNSDFRISHSPDPLRRQPTAGDHFKNRLPADTAM